MDRSPGDWFDLIGRGVLIPALLVLLVRDALRAYRDPRSRSIVFAEIMMTFGMLLWLIPGAWIGGHGPSGDAAKDQAGLLLVVLGLLAALSLRRARKKELQ